jgi:hypothetical protein
MLLSMILAFLMQTTGLTAHLEWDANPSAEMIKEYRVYRASTSGGYTSVALAVVPHVDNTLMVYEDKNLGPGTYFYVVRAVNRYDQAGPASNEVSGTIPPLPSAPTLRLSPVTSMALLVDGKQVSTVPIGSNLAYTLIVPRTTPPRDQQRLIEVKLQ